MKTAIALIAAGLLSASLPAYAQGVQPNSQAKPGPAQAPQLGTMSQTAMPQRPGAAPGAQPQIGGVGLPPLPANLQNPMAAGQTITDLFAMMELFHRVAQQQRATARESRDVSREAQFAAMEGAADKMKQAAAAALQQAQVNGAMAIASGAIVSGGMSTGAGQMAQKNLSASGKGQATTDTKAQAIAAGAGGELKAPTKALTSQEKQQGIASIIGAQQAFGANMAAADADKKRAEAAMLAAQGQQANAQSQQQAQLMQQMQAVMADVQQKLQAIMQAQNSTSQMLARP